MDWLESMNRVAGYMEEHLTERVSYGAMARMTGCSVYEFSRIFSFMTGMSLSEYIRRRRLSQAVFDLQAGERVVDVGLKYGYDSPTAFARAFRELHGVSPTEARKPETRLKTYPPISFQFTIQGVSALEFRMERTEAFQIVGLVDRGEPADRDYMDSEPALGPLWRRFMAEYDPRLYNGGGAENLYCPPFWQVAAYSFALDEETAIGAAYKGICPPGMELYTVPAAEWVVFSFPGPTGSPHVPKAYARVLTEWFPQSGYQRDQDTPNREVYPAGDPLSPEYMWEIWMPVKK